jgi:hypothetical protein
MLASGSWKTANFSEWLCLDLDCGLLRKSNINLFNRAVQLQGLGRAPGLWSSPPSQQDATRVPVSPPKLEQLRNICLCTRALTPLLLDRQIFFETGFTEMPTNQYIESGFWVCIYDSRLKKYTGYIELPSTNTVN